MKRVVLTWCLCVLLIAFFSTLGCSNSGALDYNNELIAQQGKVIEGMINLTKTFENPKAETMSAKLDELSKVIDEAIESVSKMKGYEGDTSLRDVVLELLQFYKDISANEYREMIGILGRVDGPITQQDLDRMASMNQDISSREVVLDEKLAKIQQAFAKKYNFTLARNEKQDEIDAMGKGNK